MRSKGLFDEARYATFDSGILEAFAQLFKTRAKLYVYPFRDAKTWRLTTAGTLKLTPQAQGLYDFLEARGPLVDLEGYDESSLGLRSRDALQRIRAADPSWQEMLPEPVVEVIKRRALLDYRSAVRSKVFRRIEWAGPGLVRSGTGPRLVSIDAGKAAWSA